MARPLRNDMAVKQLASAVARITKDHPTVTPKDIERWAWTNLDLAVSEESIRKALRGQIDPTQCAVELLMALAGYFGVNPSALGHIAEARLASILAYAGRQTPDDPGGLEVSRRGCNGATILDFRARQVSPATRESIAA